LIVEQRTGESVVEQEQPKLWFLARNNESAGNIHGVSENTKGRLRAKKSNAMNAFCKMHEGTNVRDELWGHGKVALILGIEGISVGEFDDAG
jgi:hypothetical protein